jgi:hypothetical protein
MGKTELAIHEYMTGVAVRGVFVDCARIGVFDVSAIDAWNHTTPADGRADIVFWGLHRFAFDFRPHTDDFSLLREIRASELEAGTIEVGGQTVCGLMTTWGDGLFPATLEVDEAQTPLRCTVTFATEQSLENMRAVNGM